jgi:hypothetical protein
MPRIGPRMLDAVRYVAAHPGCAILPVAEYCGPFGSRKYGYQTVHRAIRAGLIVVARAGRGRYSLTVVECAP